jgi:Fe-S oxidoreductase
MIIDTFRRCRKCNYCFTDCPLYVSTRGFESKSPSGIMASIYYALRWDAMSSENTESLRDILYSCTTCGGCEIRCRQSATDLPIIDVIEAGRQLLVDNMIGPLPEQSSALKSLLINGNPYGMLAEDRTRWLREIENDTTSEVKVLSKGQKTDHLLFVGCTLAYNYELVNILRSLLAVLNVLGIDYGILAEEKCCGDPAQRVGESALFEDLKDRNQEAFMETGAQTIVTICPHGFHSFENEYNNLKDSAEILHYTEFLARYLDQGKLPVRKTLNKSVTYHDPCYLGKKNNVYEPPRKILTALAGDNLVEMEKNKEKSLCCGGGGGRMFAEVEEYPRLSEIRVAHALEVGARVIATACPWCYIQLRDGVKNSGNEGNIEVKDIAELFAESLQA